MDKWQAQYSFWASFGYPAYEEHSVPPKTEITYPYITYEAVSSTFDNSTPVSASIWTRSNSWLEADTISDEIETRLRYGGHRIPYDNGIIWATPNNPFSRPSGDPEDDKIKGKTLNVQLHF